MANITKRTNKRVAAHLAPEQAEVALLCELKGALGVGAVPAALSVLTTRRVMEKRAGQRLEEEGGTASSFPNTTVAVAVTPTRVLVFPSNGLSFKPQALVLDRGEVWAELGARRGLGKRLVFTFADGTQAEVDVMAGQPLQQFLDLLSPA